MGAATHGVTAARIVLSWLGRKVEHHAAIAGSQSLDRATLVGHADKAAFSVGQESGHWLVAVRASRKAGEIVHHAFRPLPAILVLQLVNRAAVLARIGKPAAVGRAEQIALRVENRILERPF